MYRFTVSLLFLRSVVNHSCPLLFQNDIMNNVLKEITVPNKMTAPVITFFEKDK